MTTQSAATLGKKSPVVILEFTVPSSKITEVEFKRFGAELKESVTGAGEPESVVGIWGRVTERVSLAGFVQSLMVHYQLFDASVRRNFNSPQESTVVVLFAWHGCKVGVERKFKEKRVALERLVSRLSRNSTWSLTGYSSPIASACMGDTSFTGGRMIALLASEMATMSFSSLDLKVTSSGGGRFSLSPKTHSLSLRGFNASSVNPTPFDQPLTIAHKPKEAKKMNQPKITKVYVPMTKPTTSDDSMVPEINEEDVAFTTPEQAQLYSNKHMLGKPRMLKVFTTAADAFSLEEEAELQRELVGLSPKVKALLRKRGVAVA